MSAELVRVPFRTVDVEANTPLYGQLSKIRAVEERRAAIRGWRRKLMWAALANVALSLGWLGWVAKTLYYEQGYVFRYHEFSELYKWDFDWSFVTAPVYDGVMNSISATVGGVCAAIIAGVITMSAESMMLGSRKLTLFACGAVVVGTLLAIAYYLLSALLPIFPFVSWAVIIGLAVVLSKYPHLVELTSLVDDTEGLVRDNRFEEYSSFLELQSTWNEWAQLLNRYQLKLEHRQFSPEMVPTVRKALEAMRADEQFVHDRLAYLHAVAGEGDLGSRTARAQLGASVIHDLTGRMNDMRTRVKELQDLDAKAIAALQVETGRY